LGERQNMQSKNKIASISEEQEELFLTVFPKETDRGCALLGGIIIENLLEKLLRKAMVSTIKDELFEGYGPLNTFSAKIELAYGFGLISKNEKLDLHAIRKIRNEFAHSDDYSLTFDSRPINSYVQKMKLREATLLNNEKPSLLRHDFILEVCMMIGFLKSKIRQIESPEAPRDFIAKLAEHNKLQKNSTH
jgi:hypothetical protein